MFFWQNVNEALNQFDRLVLLIVVQSKGSSPGKQGFKMMIKPDDTLHGSIGGGIMEFQLVELAKFMLKADKGELTPELIHQVHGEDKQYASGMICSGTQTIALIPINKKDSKTIHNIYNTIDQGKQGLISFNTGKLSFDPTNRQSKQYSYSSQSDTNWKFSELAGFKNKMYIVGGGHVGLAMSEIMYFLGFHVIIFDHRDELSTMVNNRYCHEKVICAYDQVYKHIEASNTSYVAVLSHSHRSDLVVLKSLIDKPLAYIGAMGSPQKIKKIFKTLIEERIDREKLERVHAPIGLDINSISPEEIAISIAAQIIAVKNKRADI